MNKDRTLHYMFFTEKIEEAYAWLDEEETRHAVTVLRMNEGDVVGFTNGQGWYFEGNFVAICEKKMKIKIIRKEKIKKREGSFVFCIGLPEKEAFEETLVNLTSLGVTKIIPLVFEYSQKSLKIGEWSKYSLRFRNKMISAMKQSLSCYLPYLSQPKSIEDTIQDIEGDAFLADINGIFLKDALKTDRNNIKSVTCFIGPPGGFSEKEIFLLKDKGVLSVKIATARLRTELAATVLCSQIIPFLWSD